eukprot:gene5472-biopygen4069
MLHSPAGLRPPSAPRGLRPLQDVPMTVKVDIDIPADTTALDGVGEYNKEHCLAASVQQVFAFAKPAGLIPVVLFAYVDVVCSLLYVGQELDALGGALAGSTLEVIDSMRAKQPRSAADPFTAKLRIAEPAVCGGGEAVPLCANPVVGIKYSSSGRFPVTLTPVPLPQGECVPSPFLEHPGNLGIRGEVASTELPIAQETFAMLAGILEGSLEETPCARNSEWVLLCSTLE